MGKELKDRKVVDTYTTCKDSGQEVNDTFWREFQKAVEKMDPGEKLIVIWDDWVGGRQISKEW